MGILLSNMLRSKQFLRLAQKNKCECYQFPFKTTKEKRIIQETDTDIHALIEKYKDVFHGKLPPGLPSKRNVEMTINL